ncbi:cyclin-like protein [Schizophyllum commune]
MATDFWESSHYKRWLVDHATLRQARTEDLNYVENPEHIEFLSIYFANAIAKLGKKLGFRQRVIATATVFFRRFYLKNSYCETDPFIVIAACCYVAAKAEESPVHIKNVISDARSVFSHDYYGVKYFPTDNTKLAEMEFYLVDDLECDLTIYHPYRSLLALCTKESAAQLEHIEPEAGELGAGIGADDGPRYWGTGEGRLQLAEGALQTAWLIINDTYRSELCLLYPPHLIAVAAIYLTLVFHGPTRTALEQQLNREEPTPMRRSTRHPAPQDPVAFLSSLNVSLPTVATIAQEILALYRLWNRYKEDVHADAASVYSSQNYDMNAADAITPTQLSQVLLRMRELRGADMSHPASGRPVAINKMLERTQAAG